MQFNNKQAIKLLKKLHAGGFPSAIVAGGCVRDELFGKPVKDIDMFVSYEDVYVKWHTNDHIAHFENAVERRVVKEDWSSYMDIPDVASVYTILPVGEELPAQVIVMDPGLSPKERLEFLDFSFCQVSYDGYWLHKTEAFLEDEGRKKMTLVHCENQHEFDRSMVRYERLKQKYPEFKLVIPQEFQQYQNQLHGPFNNIEDLCRSLSS